MVRENEVDRLIREALQAENVEAFEGLDEPNLPAAVTEIFRGQMRWYGTMFLMMILVFSLAAVYCGVRFLAAEEMPEMMRWAVGLFIALGAVMGGKNWWWMQVERIAMTREIKRVELLVAHLAARLQPNE